MTKPRRNSPQRAARRSADHLLALYHEMGPGGRLPSREWLCGRLNISVTVLDQTNALLVAGGKINRLGRGCNIAYELVGTTWTLRLRKAGSDSKDAPAIGAVPGEGRVREQTQAFLDRCDRLGVRFEDSPQARRPELRLRMTRPHDFSLTGASL